jgi:hypothetical protein
MGEDGIPMDAPFDPTGRQLHTDGISWGPKGPRQLDPDFQPEEWEADGTRYWNYRPVRDYFARAK